MKISHVTNARIRKTYEKHYNNAMAAFQYMAENDFIAMEDCGRLEDYLVYCMGKSHEDQKVTKEQESFFKKSMKDLEDKIKLQCVFIK